MTALSDSTRADTGQLRTTGRPGLAQGLRQATNSSPHELAIYGLAKNILRGNGRRQLSEVIRIRLASLN